MKNRPQIDSETPIVPVALATAVLEEASVWLDEPLPRHWARELCARMRTVYASNPQFRDRIRGPGSLGRDRLWAFARHWLSALIQERRPHLHRRLPASDNVGYPLPATATRAPSCAPSAFRARRPSDPLRRARGSRSGSELAWAAAAHFHLV